MATRPSASARRSASSCRSLDHGVRGGDRQDDALRRADAEGLVAMHHDLVDIAVDQEVRRPAQHLARHRMLIHGILAHEVIIGADRKSTRLNSSHSQISYAV